MKCFVTGANGFIGSTLVSELNARGHRVKALLRPGADERGLRGAEFQRVTGDLTDRDLLVREMDGCDWCFHLAASYHLWQRNYAAMYATNVAGTRTVLSAAGQAGCRKIVYTSTVGCIGLPQALNGRLVPATETELITTGQLSNHYKCSKFQAEGVAAELFRKNGLPIVIVNPSAPIGPGDWRPTPTGAITVSFLNRQLPAYMNTGLNFVHVRDVAVGHVLAAEKGRLGERYILGHREGNWTLHQLLTELAKITGLPVPRRQLPYSLALGIAKVSEALAWFTGRPPLATQAGVRMARDKMWFDPDKAIRELRLPQTPPAQAVAEAVAWFRANGYVKR